MPFEIDRLRELREDKGLTQSATASLLNMSTSAYGHYETGGRKPPLDTLEKIADLFKCSTDYLLGRTDSPLQPTRSNNTESREKQEKKSLRFNRLKQDDALLDLIRYVVKEEIKNQNFADDKSQSNQ